MSERLLYHYTSSENWKLIRKTGELQPRTSWGGRYCFDPPRRELFTYALLDHPLSYGWIVSGLLSFLDEKAHVVLEFPLRESKKVLVREAYYLTPDSMISSVGINLWKRLQTGKINMAQFERRKPYLDYLHSTVSYGRYDDSYKVPEIMIPYTVYVDEITARPRSQIKKWKLQTSPHPFQINEVVHL